MEPRLLDLYNSELRHLRGMGGEFAQQYPKIAGRLGLDSFRCADPYVERLLEGFAFLAARVQLKIEAEYPRFTQHLLDVVYPDYLASLPSMTVVQFQADPREGSLVDGFPVPRGTVLRSAPIGPHRTTCEFRTAHDIDLFPLEIASAEYFLRSRVSFPLPDLPDAKAGLRFVFRSSNHLPLSQQTFNNIDLFLRGDSELTSALYEQMLAHTVAIVARPLRPELPSNDPQAGQRTAGQVVLNKTAIKPLGFEDEQALLPVRRRGFQGYRLLQEYFACPERFHFVSLTDLARARSACDSCDLEVFVLFDQPRKQLEQSVNRNDFSLHCTPAINLFPKRADRIHLSDRREHFHVVPDRTRPLDYEVHSINRVTGHGLHGDEEQEFLPFYGRQTHNTHATTGAFYAIERQPRMSPREKTRRTGDTAYRGSEMFLSLVDESESPYQHDLRALSVETLCTNRDLGLEIPFGSGSTDFSLQMAAPVLSVRCLSEPGVPRPSPAVQRGELGWQLINMLSLNYLSLADNNPEEGAVVLRKMLQLQSQSTKASIRKQIEGVRHISAEPVTRRLPLPGPVAFGRGLSITLTCDEDCFEGSSVFLLGSVLERFFSRYASINSFTETKLNTLQRDEVMRWPVRAGQRHTF